MKVSEREILDRNSINATEFKLGIGDYNKVWEFTYIKKATGEFPIAQLYE